MGPARLVPVTGASEPFPVAAAHPTEAQASERTSA
jgi:hypothetical protein